MPIKIKGAAIYKRKVLFWEFLGVINFYFLHRMATSSEESEIFYVQIRPAGEYSRFFVQSRAKSARRKTIGGDSWRVYLEGPSNVAGTVFDHNNGIYEVLFLIMEPGAYKINMILDYTLCDGLIDPPVDWFRSGKKRRLLKNSTRNTLLQNTHEALKDQQ